MPFRISSLPPLIEAGFSSKVSATSASGLGVPATIAAMRRAAPTELSWGAPGTTPTACPLAYRSTVW